MNQQLVRIMFGAAVAASVILSSGTAQAAPCSGIDIGGVCFHFTSITLPGFEGELVGANARGELVGTYSPVNTFIHPSYGFEFERNGTLETVQEPLAATNLTELTQINDKGEMLGWFYDGNYVHGFTRSNAGVFASYDFFPPTVRNTGTELRGLNNMGDFVGRTIGMLPADVAFLKAGNTVETFTYLTGTTYVSGVNNHRDVVGFSIAGGVTHGYLRSPNGVITPIDFPGAKNTGASCINDLGVIGGTYTDVADHVHGFIYEPATHQYHSFDIPGTGANGTNVLVITNRMEIYGNYFVGSTPTGYRLER